MNDDERIELLPPIEIPDDLAAKVRMTAELIAKMFGGEEEAVEVVEATIQPLVAGVQWQLDEARQDAERYRTSLANASKAIREIVCVDGVDAGVIYLSSDSPTRYDPDLKIQVYEYENFSALGDALVNLAKQIDAARAAGGEHGTKEV